MRIFLTERETVALFHIIDYYDNIEKLPEEIQTIAEKMYESITEVVVVR